MNKFKTNAFLRGKGFTVPNATLLEKSEWTALAEDAKEDFIKILLSTHQLALPLIVKPHDDGCSVMVYKAESLPALIKNIDTFFTSPKTAVLLEEMINGVELTVGVLGNEHPQALPPSLSVAKAGILSQEEKFLPGAGENQTPAPLPEAVLNMIQTTVRNAFIAIGCVGYSRIDCFYQDESHSPTGKERVVLLEINTVPALTPATCLFHQAAEIGINPMDFIDTIVDLGLKHHQKHVQSESTYAPAQSEISMVSAPTQVNEASVFKPIPEEELHQPIIAETKKSVAKKDEEDLSLRQAKDESFTMKLF